MPGSSFGHALRITTAGESHGPANVVILDGVPPGIALSVSMKSDGDVLQLGERLTTEMARIKNDLPVGIEFHQVSNQPKVVKAAVGTFMRSLLEAVAIVLAVISFVIFSLIMIFKKRLER